jgi:hypothetical protein
MENLLENHTYLVKKWYTTNDVNSITALLITNEAYKVRWNDSNYIGWLLKKEFNDDYKLIEDITVILNDKPEKPQFNIKTNPFFIMDEDCSACNGTGQISSPEFTTGTRMCYACNGSGKKSKRVNIFF